MKRIFASVAGMFVVVLGLTACGTTDLSIDPMAANSSSASDDSSTVPADASADNADTTTPAGPPVFDTVTGVADHDGSVERYDLWSGGDVGVNEILVSQPPELPEALPIVNGVENRYTARYLSWQELAEKVGQYGWYTGGVTSFANRTGFSWDDVLRFAEHNGYIGDDYCAIESNAMIIQVFNSPEVTVEQAQEQVATWVADTADCKSEESRERLRQTMLESNVQHINGGFMNTMNGGSASDPSLKAFFDTSKMVRGSLTPFVKDEAGNVALNEQGKPQLDGSRGAGIFIDCGNLHWVPVAIWTCKDTNSCEIPPCPPGMIGSQPNCEWPPTCPPGQVGTPPHCTTPPPPTTHTPPPTTHTPPPTTHTPPPTPPTEKNPSEMVIEDGWTPLAPGPLTTGQESEQQHESGEVSGNVIDAPVPAGTESGDTTPDLPPEIPIVAPGATEGGDDRGDDVIDPGVVNEDTGGTNGDTCIVDPDTGESMCG